MAAQQRILDDPPVERRGQLDDPHKGRNLLVAREHPRRHRDRPAHYRGQSGQNGAFPPWDHNYAGEAKVDDLPDFSNERPRIARFEESPTGFVLETGGANRTWRFEIGDHLPRPTWPGTGRPRDFLESESLTSAFLIAHDCYLEV